MKYLIFEIEFILFITEIVIISNLCGDTVLRIGSEKNSTAGRTIIERYASLFYVLGSLLITKDQCEIGENLLAVVYNSPDMLFIH